MYAVIALVLCALLASTTATAPSFEAIKETGVAHITQLKAERAQGLIDSCSFCTKGVDFIQSQFIVGAVAGTNELRILLEAVLCENDETWEPLCKAISRWGEYKFLTFLIDYRISPEALCYYLNQCHDCPSQKELAMLFKEFVEREQSNLLGEEGLYGSHVVGEAECWICQRLIDFLQAQVAIGIIDTAETLRTGLQENCRVLCGDDRDTKVPAICQSAINYGFAKLYERLSDERLWPMEVCVEIGSCSPWQNRKKIM